VNAVFIVGLGEVGLFAQNPSHSERRASARSHGQ